MLVQERQQRIIELLKKENACTVNDLSIAFEVSKDTIRRDLKHLAEIGAIERTHGGAIRKRGVSFYPPIKQRESVQVEEKQAIGKLAATLVEEGDALFIDSGTTTAQLVKHLDKGNLTVVTNAVNLLTYLIDSPYIKELVLTGGKLEMDGLYLAGFEAENQITRYNCDKLFLSTNGVSFKYGITSPSRDEAQVKRGMIEAAKQVILLTDHSKFGERGLITFADVSELDIVVTDWQVDGRIISGLREKGVEVIIADQP